MGKLLVFDEFIAFADINIGDLLISIVTIHANVRTAINCGQRRIEIMLNWQFSKFIVLNCSSILVAFLVIVEAFVFERLKFFHILHLRIEF